MQEVNAGTLEVEVVQGEDGKTYITNNSKLSGLANEVLITAGGQCNWDNISEVGKAGFVVFPGEQDSFGWLVGCISTNKGIVTYG